MKLPVYEVGTVVYSRTPEVYAEPVGKRQSTFFAREIFFGIVLPPCEESPFHRYNDVSENEYTKVVTYFEGFLQEWYVLTYNLTSEPHKTFSFNAEVEDENLSSW